MRIKNTKRALFRFSPYECTATEEYLEIMAEKGWLLESIKGIIFKFKKIEPKKIKYSVDILNEISAFDHSDSELALEYREYCNKAGWNYVCEKGKIQIFYTEDYQNTIPIHTDENEKFKSVFKASLHYLGKEIYSMMFSIFIIFFQLFSGNAGFLANNLGLICTLLIIFNIFLSIVEVFSFFMWSKKAKRKLKENKFMPYNNYKEVKRKNMFKNFYLLILMSILISSVSFGNKASKEFNIVLLFVIFTSMMAMNFIEKYIDKKKYSRYTNMSISFASDIFISYLAIILIVISIFIIISKPESNKIMTEISSLSLSDFGYKEKSYATPDINFNKSIIAKNIDHYYTDEDYDLDYTIFESKYPWIIKFNTKRLLFINTKKYSDGFRELNTNISGEIKVYSDNDNSKFILISEDKIIDIRKDFEDLSTDEFLNVVYNKVLK